MNVYLILGTGTNVGKTYFCSKVIKYLVQYNCKPEQIFAIKPVISGYNKNDTESDLQILQSCLNNHGKIKHKDISIYRLKQPLSPDIAAVKDGVDLNFENITEFCKNKIQTCLKLNIKHFFIETAGGLLSPIAKQQTCLDLAKNINEFCKNEPNIKFSSILVGSCYLGCINHSLSSLVACSYYNFKINSFVFNNISEEENYCNLVFDSIKKNSFDKIDTRFYKSIDDFLKSHCIF
jgi:dethiobiotin synthetase